MSGSKDKSIKIWYLGEKKDIKVKKKELEELGRENGIVLDKRKNKAALIEELKEAL